MRKRKQKSVMLILAIISLISWWRNLGEAEQPATPPAAASPSVDKKETDRGQGNPPDAQATRTRPTPDNFDPQLYRLSTGEWGTRRWLNNSGDILSRQVWVPEGRLMRITKRDMKLLMRSKGQQATLLGSQRSGNTRCLS